MTDPLLDALADLINPYTGDNELNGKIARALAPHVTLTGVDTVTDDAGLLREIRDRLKSIDDRLAQSEPKRAEYKLKLGRVYSAGQTIPDNVDLVLAAGGRRWRRDVEHTPAGPLPTDYWYPRDVEGPVLSTAELLARAGHVTEIPAPAEEGT